MDLKIPDSLLRKYLQTKATAEKIGQALTLCGPSVDRLHHLEDDYVYDIEVITNRVDSASAFGIAREAAAVLPQFGISAKLVNSPYEIRPSELPERKSPALPLTVEIKDKSLVPHFAAIVLDHLTIKPSDNEIQKHLRLSDIRPLFNLIDVTNYLTLCFGQPVHIFDYDKIGSAKMILRESKRGEKVTTLDGKTHLLKGGDIVIEDGDGKLIDLCGIMGAKNSEVDENTKRAVLFVQTYHPKKIRTTSLYTQERTLAAQIFEKQPDTRLVIPTLIEGVKLLEREAGAHVASDSIDLYFEKPESRTIKLDFKWLRELIGVDFEEKTVTSILTSLGFSVKRGAPKLLSVSVPSWRLNDVAIRQDLAEEIARVYGYFRMESHLPVREYLTEGADPLLEWEYQAKLYLSHLGFTEVFNYSLVSLTLFEKAGLGIEPSVKLTNPLASEFEYLRRSLIPSILSNLENNQGKVDLPIRLFELANIYLPADKHDLPDERSILAFATQGLDYRTAKGYLLAILANLGLTDITLEPIDEETEAFLQNQTASVYSGQHSLGIFGPINSQVKENFKLSSNIFLANLDFVTIAALANKTRFYQPASDYPDLIEDVTLDSKKLIGQLIQLIKQESKLIIRVIYKESLGCRHTFTVHFNNPKKNLTQTEVDIIKGKVLALA